MHFLLALMGKEARAGARMVMYKVMGRSNIGGMYLREFGRLVALIVAVPSIPGIPLDSGVVCMLQLSQLLTACWRRAVSTATPEERECAAVSLKMTASVLATLYTCLKPHDPETKSAGVFNLYLHAALAHVRTTVGKAFPTAKHVCDDNIEGKISELNAFFSTRTNNVSRGEAMVNKEAVQPTEFNATQSRTAVEMMIYTKEIAVCACVFALGAAVRDDVVAAVAFAEGDDVLEVKSNLAAPRGTPTAVFSLPDAIQDLPKSPRAAEEAYAPSSKLVLRESLRASQRSLKLCTCGLLSGMLPSAVGLKATALHQQDIVDGNADDDTAAAASVLLAGSSSEPAEAGTAGTTLNEHVSREAFLNELEKTSEAADEVADGGDGEGAGDGADDGRLYSLEGRDVDADEVGDEVEESPADLSPDDCPPVLLNNECPGAFLLQQAVKDDSLLPFLPTEEVVDMIFVPAVLHVPADRERLLHVRHKIEEDMLMMDWLYQRLRTPIFGEWVERDGINIRDLLLALGRMQRRMHLRLASLVGPGQSV